MTSRASDLLKWLPVAAVAAGLVASYVTLENQAAANAEELRDLSESVDENEEELDQLRLRLLDQQRLTEGEVKEIQGDVKLILRLLEEQRREQR